MEGTVKWYDRKKGYGFIHGEDGGDYFVHYSQVAEGTDLRDNSPVTFDAVETDKGKQAQNVKSSEGGPAPSEAEIDQAAEEETEQTEELTPEDDSASEEQTEPEESKEE